MTSLTLDESWTDSGSSLNSEAHADVDVGSDTLHSLVNCAVAGSGHAEARLLTDFSPSSDGDYEIAVEYYRNADMYLGTGKIHVVVEDDFGGVDKHELEELKGGANGTVTRSAEDVTLDSGTTYQLGVEVQTTAGTTGAISIADFYNSIHFPPGIGPRHRVEVNDFRIR